MTERTFSIIKPDATRRNLTGAINDRLEKAGLRIVAQDVLGQLQRGEPAVHPGDPPGVGPRLQAGPRGKNVEVFVVRAPGHLDHTWEVLGSHRPDEFDSTLFDCHHAYAPFSWTAPTCTPRVALAGCGA